MRILWLTTVLLSFTLTPLQTVANEKTDKPVTLVICEVEPNGEVVIIRIDSGNFTQISSVADDNGTVRFEKITPGKWGAIEGGRPALLNDYVDIKKDTYIGCTNNVALPNPIPIN